MNKAQDSNSTRKKDFFAHKAAVYEQNARRVSNVDCIAQTILSHVTLEKNQHLMDFGAGTGLLLERIAPHVEKITAVDTSISMIEALGRKRDQIDCDLEILEINLESDAIARTNPPSFDGIISSMTIHHIQDVKTLFDTFYSLTREGGFIAISDLDKEDGSFHTEDTGVHHFGFEREAFAEMASAAGFKDIAVVDASLIQKPQGDYGVFLLTARR